MIATALVVGLLTAAGIWLFKQLIYIFSSVMFGSLSGAMAQVGEWRVALIPVIGGVLVGLFLHYFVGVEQYHGVAGIIESVTFGGGRLRYWRIPAKTVAAALAIGSGASVGPEDPSVQIGANIGSLVGQRLKYSDEKMRAIVAAGAASGIAAAFNAPIAAVFFALEVILGEIGGSSIGLVVLAAVSSAVLTQAISGAHPAFSVAPYAFQSVWELPLYMLLGLLAGLVASQYVRLIDRFQVLFHHLPIPNWLKPASAGLIVGLVGVFFPQVFGVGYETIDKIFNGAPLPLLLLIILLLAKLILTPLCVGSGFPGGVFAPALFIGAALGSAFGQAAGILFPQVGVMPIAMAMVGMAAMLAGSVHAPLTAILLLFEMTNDYRIILPLMLAVMISLFVSQSIQRESVYLIPLVRKGLRIQRGKDIELLETIMVEQVMQTDFVPLREDDPIPVAMEELNRQKMQGLPVVDAEDRVCGILTVQDVENAALRKPKAQTVGEICSRNTVVAFADETVSSALQKMGSRDIGRLPVVERSNPGHLVGILRRSEVIRAYNIALASRAALRHRSHQARLGIMGGMRVEEFTIETGSLCDGNLLSEISWPRSCIVSSLRRGQSLLIPHGDTRLQAGDVLVIVFEREVEGTLQQLVRCHVNHQT